MNDKSLFRKEALENHFNQNLGSVSINTPIHYRYLTFCVAFITIALLFFLVTVTFSETFTLSGYVNSEEGVVSVYPEKNGSVISCLKREGDSVKTGELLFVIGTTQPVDDKSQSNEWMQNLSDRLAVLSEEIRLKNDHLKSLQSLLKHHYIPITQFNQSKEALLELHNKKKMIEMELIHYQQNQSYDIRSPHDGFITNLLFKPGQFVSTSKPLLHLIPVQSHFFVELYLPVKQAGDIEPGMKVLLSFDAYPASRYGRYQAVVSSISQTVLTDDEETKPVLIGMPYFKVKAELNQQTLQYDGKRKQLQHGLTLSAVILGKRRKIWQWL